MTMPGAADTLLGTDVRRNPKAEPFDLEAELAQVVGLEDVHEMLRMLQVQVH